MSELDILSIDAKIRKNFEEEFLKLSDHMENLHEIKESIKNENIRRRIRASLEKARDELENYLDGLSTKKNYN